MADDSPESHKLPARIEAILATVSEHFAHRNEELLQRIIVNSRYSVNEWSYDNWDGGTRGYALTFQVPRPLFSEAVGQIDCLCDRMRKVVNDVNSLRNEFVEKVFLEVEAGDSTDWRMKSGALLPRDSSGVPLEPSMHSDSWSPSDFRLFLSHVSSAKAPAHQLKRAFAVYGIGAFVAHDDIEPTALWQREIERALASMHALVAVVTPGFRDSFWCQQEVGWALGRSVPVIALRAGEDPPAFVSAQQALSADLAKPADVARGVTRLLVKDGRTAALIRDRLVVKIEETESWEMLRDVIDVFLDVQELPFDQADRIERAYATNSHLASSHSLPTLKAFIAKRRV